MMNKESGSTNVAEASYMSDRDWNRLQVAKNEYEVSRLSNICNHVPLAPFAKISPSRYQLDVKFGQYIGHDIECDGVADILLVGDIMCRAAQQTAALEKYGTYDFQDMFPLMKKTLSGFDFLAGNLESTISESAYYTHELNRSDNRLNRNSPNTMLDAVRAAGFDLVVTANNHCMDAGMTGLYQTICHLEQYKLLHTGTFRDKKDHARHPHIMVEIDGIKVAFLGYTYGTNGRIKQIKKVGRKHFVNTYKKSIMESDVAGARAAGAEFIIVYMHWGTEYTHDVSKEQMLQAKELADAGVDFIAGSHPHVVQPFGTVTGESGNVVPVIYSMGNFISSMTQVERRDSVSINLKLCRENGSVKLKELSYLPCYTCIKYGDYDYTTVPLSDELCKDNAELREAKARIRDVMSKGVPLPEYCD